MVRIPAVNIILPFKKQTTFYHIYAFPPNHELSGLSFSTITLLSGITFIAGTAKRAEISKKKSKIPDKSLDKGGIVL